MTTSPSCARSRWSGRARCQPIRRVTIRPPRLRPRVPVVPRVTPPVRRAKAVKGGDASPGGEATPAPRPPMPEPSDPGEIRMTPTTGVRTPEQAQLQIADSYYSRKMYDTAAPEYQRFVDQYPTSDDIPAALFRLAESYRRMGSLNSAKNAYDSLLTRFQVSDFAGPAAYRLADIFYQERNYSSALPWYRKAAQRLKEPAVASAALFYTARCLEATGGAGQQDGSDGSLPRTR